MKQDRPSCCECYERRFAEYCHSCGDVIGVDDDQLNKGKLHWHANDKCFSCCSCSLSLVGSPFLPKDDEIYCSVECSEISSDLASSFHGSEHLEDDELSHERHEPEIITVTPQLRKVKETTFDEFNNVRSDVKLVNTGRHQMSYDVILSKSARNSQRKPRIREDDVILAVPVEDLESGKDSTYGTETSSIIEEDIQRNRFLSSGYGLERSCVAGNRFQRQSRENDRGYDTDCPTSRVLRKSSERSTDRGYETDGATRLRTSERRMVGGFEMNERASRGRQSRGYESDGGRRRVYGEYNMERGYETDGATRRAYNIRNQESRRYETDGGSRNCTRNGQSRGYETDGGSRNCTRNVQSRGYETDGGSKNSTRNVHSRGNETDGGSRNCTRNGQSRGYETDGGSRNCSRNGQSRGYETDGGVTRVSKDRILRSKMKGTSSRTVIYTDLMNEPTEESHFNREAPLCMVYTNDKPTGRSLASMSARMYSSFREGGQHKSTNRKRLEANNLSKVNSHSMEDIERRGNAEQYSFSPECSRNGMRRTSRNISSESSTRERKGSSGKKNLPWEDPFANPVSRDRLNQENKLGRIRYVDEVGGMPESNRVIHQLINSKTPKTERKSKSKKECRVQ